MTTRGRPFRKGNPGRPSGARHKSTLAIEALLEGEAEAIGRKVIEKALEGDATALRLAMERLYPVRKGRPLAFDMPPLDGATDLSLALGSVLTAIATGELTAEEGVSLAQIIDARRRSIETMELERRILDLEGLLKDG
jgi:hypothetical protein